MHEDAPSRHPFFESRARTVDWIRSSLQDWREGRALLATERNQAATVAIARQSMDEPTARLSLMFEEASQWVLAANKPDFWLAPILSGATLPQDWLARLDAAIAEGADPAEALYLRECPRRAPSGRSRSAHASTPLHEAFRRASSDVFDRILPRVDPARAALPLDGLGRTPMEAFLGQTCASQAFHGLGSVGPHWIFDAIDMTTVRRWKIVHALNPSWTAQPAGPSLAAGRAHSLGGPRAPAIFSWLYPQWGESGSPHLNWDELAEVDFASMPPAAAPFRGKLRPVDPLALLLAATRRHPGAGEAFAAQLAKLPAQERSDRAERAWADFAWLRARHADSRPAHEEAAALRGLLDAHPSSRLLLESIEERRELGRAAPALAEGPKPSRPRRL